MLGRRTGESARDAQCRAGCTGWKASAPNLLRLLAPSALKTRRAALDLPGASPLQKKRQAPTKAESIRAICRRAARPLRHQSLWTAAVEYGHFLLPCEPQSRIWPRYRVSRNATTGEVL